MATSGFRSSSLWFINSTIYHWAIEALGCAREECPMGIYWITIHIVLHIWDYTLSISNFPILTEFHAVKGTHVISRQVIKNMTRRRKGKCKTGPLPAALRKTSAVFRHLCIGLFRREQIVLIWVSSITTTIT